MKRTYSAIHAVVIAFLMSLAYSYSPASILLCAGTLVIFATSISKKYERRSSNFSLIMLFILSAIVSLLILYMWNQQVILLYSALLMSVISIGIVFGHWIKH